MTYPQLKEMADRIKRRREALGFTQEGFSEVISLSASSYTKIENAFQKPALDTLINIALHLDLSLDYIVFGAGDSSPGGALDIEFLQALLKYADRDKLLHASKVLAKIAKIRRD